MRDAYSPKYNEITWFGYSFKECTDPRSKTYQWNNNNLFECYGTFLFQEKVSSLDYVRYHYLRASASVNSMENSHNFRKKILK